MTSASNSEAMIRTVTYRGGSLHVVDRPGDGPPIVLMHGFPDDHHIYDRLIPMLAPRRTVAFDWLGYGESARRDRSSFDPTDRQRELAAVIDDLQLADVVLVGHDASGPEAIDYAVSHTDNVSAVVLMNTYYGHAPALHFPEMISLLADADYHALADALMDDESQRLWLL